MADETQANTTPDGQQGTIAPTNQTVDVSTSAPDQVQTENAPPSTQTIQPQAGPSNTPIAAAASQPPQPSDPLSKRIFAGIMGALGGTQDISYQRGADGKMVTTVAASGTGTQWKRIITGALQGTAAGLGAAPGPGQLARAGSAGFAASAPTAPAQEQQKVQQADQDFTQQQKALVTKAQTQLLTYQGSVANFQLKRMGVEAAQENAGMENQFMKAVQSGGNGSQDLGVAKNFADVLAMHKDMPNLMKENAQGNIIQTAHVDADGNFDGTRYALVTPQWKDAKLTEDAGFYHLVPASKPGEMPTIQKQTVKAGTISNGDFANQQAAASSEILKWQTENHKEAHQDRVDTSTINKNAAESVKDLAQAGKAQKETAAIPSADDLNDSEIVKGMLDGSVDITKTASIRGNRRELYIDAAKKQDPNFNMQDYQTKLQVRKDFSGGGKASDQIQSFNTFLGHADDYSTAINALRNSHSPLINKPINWLKKNAEGNPAVAPVLIAQSAAKTEFQAFLNNNHALLAQDKDEGEKMLNEDMSPASSQAAMRQFITTASIRMSAVNHTYYRTFGTDAPNMLDEDGKAALAHFGVPESMVYHHPTGVAAPNKTQAPQAKTPAFNWGDHPVAQ